MKKIFLAIFIIVVLVGSFAFIGQHSYKSGYNKGINDAFFATIDTLNAINKRTLKSDSTITKLFLITHHDTIIYYLSNQTIKAKLIK